MICMLWDMNGVSMRIVTPMLAITLLVLLIIRDVILPRFVSPQLNRKSNNGGDGDGDGDGTTWEVGIFSMKRKN